MYQQAFAGAVKAGFPDHLRLSIHQSTGEQKISMSLLNTKTGFTTPWHCSVALTANGDWVSAPMGDFKADPKMEVVYENGRPSYFRETTAVDGSSTTGNSKNEVLDVTTQEECSPEIQATNEEPNLGKAEVEKMTVLARRISAESPKNHDSNLSFLGQSHALVDPSSPEFNLRTWLQNIMGLAARNPDRYPKGVAGVSYRGLSVHGIGAVTDHQKTFGNYPLELIKLGHQLLSNKTRAKVHILRNFNGLVKSGEMLMVLGRPGR